MKQVAGDGRQLGEEMDKDAIELMIVDDHDLVRAGLRELIKEQDDIVLVGEAENGGEVLKRSRELHPDVLLVDIKLGDMSGIDVVRQLKRDEDTMGIECLMLTVYDDMDVATEAIRAGAIGYILKDCSKEELLDAVRKASRGELHLDPEISRKVLEVLKANGGERLATFLTLKEDSDLVGVKGEDILTSREREVLRLIVQGYKYRDIAQELYIALPTVKAHASSLYRKLGVEDRAGAILAVVKLGWI
jgi:DNA-binding NarL/FixJ family response regulator